MTHFVLLSFLSFVMSPFLNYFSIIISNYRTSVGWLTMNNWKKNWITPSSSIRNNEPEFIWRKKEKLVITVVSAGTQWIHIHSATAIKTVQFIGGIITRSNFMSYLSRIIVNDNSIQTSVKRIKAKRKIHNDLSQKNTAPILLILTVYL